MTPEERVRVEEDGMNGGWCVITGGCLTITGQSKFIADMIATHIRAAIADAVAEERERCAKVAQEDAGNGCGDNCREYLIATYIRKEPPHA